MFAFWGSGPEWYISSILYRWNIPFWFGTFSLTFENFPKWFHPVLHGCLQLCDTYPSLLYVPSVASTPVVVGSSKFRSRGRLPALSYIHRDNQVIWVQWRERKRRERWVDRPWPPPLWWSAAPSSVVVDISKLSFIPRQSGSLRSTVQGGGGDLGEGEGGGPGKKWAEHWWPPPLSWWAASSSPVKDMPLLCPTLTETGNLKSTAGQRQGAARNILVR